MAHIVIVDDDEAGNRLLKRLLETDGHTVEAFDKPEDALEYMQSYYVDMLITDLMMPKMNGFELCEYIRQYMSADEFPVMILTARQGNEDRFKGYEVGANAYMTKPFDKNELFYAINHLMGDAAPVEESW